MPQRDEVAIWKDASNSDPWDRMRFYGLCKAGSWGALACRGGHASRLYRRLWQRRGKPPVNLFRRNSWLFLQRGGPAATTCYVWFCSGEPFFSKIPYYFFTKKGQLNDVLGLGLNPHSLSRTSTRSFTTCKILGSRIFSNNLPMSEKVMGE